MEKLTAKHVGEATWGLPGRTKLWALSRSVRDDEHGTYSHVATSVGYVFGRPETYIFATTKDGESIDPFIELAGSEKDTTDHDAAIARFLESHNEGE